MSHVEPRLGSLVSIDRRTFLRGAAVGAAATAGLEGILEARKAPAFAQGTKIHLLQWVDFIPEGDTEVRRQVAEYTKQMKVEVVFETINANDLQARITAAIQSGARRRGRIRSHGRSAAPRPTPAGRRSCSTPRARWRRWRG